jgi:DNA-binding transcriptional LysR family regulator
MVMRGEADIASRPKALDPSPELAALPTTGRHHVVVVPTGHALAARAARAAGPRAHLIITYSPEFTGRSHINEAFTGRGLEIDVVLTAIDSDVIKTYVELGLGIGIIAAMAFDAQRDANLRALDAAHLFRSSITRIGVKRGTLLRGFAYAFIEAFAQQLRRPIVEQALSGAAPPGDTDSDGL